MLEKTGELTESTALLADPNALRQRAADEGYLFLRGQLQPKKVLALRGQIIEILACHGLVDATGPGCETVVAEAVAALPADQIIEQCMTLAIYQEILKLEALHALPNDPALMGFFGLLFDERPFLHPRHIARVILPAGSFVPTPPHQDFPLLQGALEAWTVWIPLADTPISMGPLAVLKGSHKHGLLDRYITPGAGGTGAKIGGLPADWRSTDFKAGDVLAFSSLTVHRALPQADKGRVRLSLDARYQPASKPIQALSLRPHSASYVAFSGLANDAPLPAWSDVYADWSGEAPQYYWRDYDLCLTPFDSHLLPALDGLNDEQRGRLEARMNDPAGL